MLKVGEGQCGQVVFLNLDSGLSLIMMDFYSSGLDPDFGLGLNASFVCLQ